MSGILKYTFLENLRLHFINTYLLHSGNCLLDHNALCLPILYMHVCGQDLLSAPCPLWLTLHFITAMIFFVEILQNTKCSSSWYHVLPNATALFLHFNELVTSLQLLWSTSPGLSLTVIISQPQEMMNNMLVVSILPFLLQYFKSAALSHFETSIWNNCTRLFSAKSARLI